MIRTLVILVLLVAVFAVVFAPAALLRQALPTGADVAFTDLTGTLWKGDGNLLLDGSTVGNVAWRLEPVTILQGMLGYHLELTGPAQALDIQLRLRPGAVDAVIDGTIEGSHLNTWLGVYDIALAGRFALKSVRVTWPYPFERSADPVPAPGSADGQMHWTGGQVNYRLAGEDFAGTLPPLDARFGPGLEAEVHAVEWAGSGASVPTGGIVPDGGPALLLRLEVLGNGFVRIGMTRLLTRMLNNPWPGTDADHEVVLQVEEQLL